ncbi:WD40 repeat domain-containing protein [Micromonospora zamorensis]|uniref:WD40 repeat domain-containing protein n=1 Tax=Micromonospora zamorensis TaxID=709883 RepID=UPI00399D692A
MLPELGNLRSLPAGRAAALVDAWVLRVTEDGAWDAARLALAEFTEGAALPTGHPALVGLASLRASLASADGDSARAAPLWAKLGRLAPTHPVPQMRTVYSVRARLMRIAAGSGEPLLLRRCLNVIDALLSPRETDPVRRGHGEYVAELAIVHVSDRRTLVSASGDGTVRLWDLQGAGEVGAPLPGHAGGARTLSVASLDGRPVAVVGAGDGMVHAWDLGTQAPIRAPLPLHRGSVLAVATAVADGRLIAVSSGSDGAVRAHDVVTGAAAGPAREGPPDSVGPVSIARLDDGLVVVAALQDGLRGTLHVWDLRSGAPVFTPPAPLRGGAVWAISTLDDGDRVLAAFTTVGATVHVWDLRTGKPVGPAGWYPGLGLPAVALTRWDDRLVAITGGGMENGQVRLTDVATGLPIGRPTHGEHGTVYALVTWEEPDGLRVYSGGNDHAIRSWTFSTGTLPLAQALLGALFAAITASLDAAESGTARRQAAPNGLDRLVTIAGAIGGPAALAYARVLAARAGWLAGGLGEQDPFDDAVFDDAAAADGPLPPLVAAGWPAPAHVGDHLCLEHLRMRPDAHPTPDAASVQGMRARHRLRDPDADRLVALLLRRETGVRPGAPGHLRSIAEALPGGLPPMGHTAGHAVVKPLRVELAYAGLATSGLKVADAAEVRMPGAPAGRLTAHEWWQRQKLAGAGVDVCRSALLRLLAAAADAPTVVGRLRSVAARIGPEHSYDDVSLAFDLVEAAELTGASVPGLLDAVEGFSAWQWWRAHPSRLEQCVCLALRQAVLAHASEPVGVGWVRRLVPPHRLAELLLQSAEALQHRLPIRALPLAGHALDMFERTGDHYGAFRSGALVDLLVTAIGGEANALRLRRLYEAFTAVSPDLPDWDTIAKAAADGDNGALPHHPAWGTWLLQLVALLQSAGDLRPARPQWFAPALAVFRARSGGRIANLRIDALGHETLDPRVEPMPFDAVPRKAGLRITTTTTAGQPWAEVVVIDEPTIPPVWASDRAPASAAALREWSGSISMRVDESVDGLPWESTMTERLGSRPRIWRESPVPGNRRPGPASWSGVLYAPEPWAGRLQDWFGALPLTLPADTDPWSIGAAPLLVLVGTATGVDDRPHLLIRPQTTTGFAEPAAAIDPRQLYPNRRALIVVVGEPIPAERWDARRRRDAFALRMSAADVMAAGAQAVWFVPAMPPVYGETVLRAFAHALLAGADPRDAAFAAQAALEARLPTATGWANLPAELTVFSRHA